MKTLARRVRTRTVTVEPFSGLDGQGKPSYGAGQEIEVRTVRTSAKSTAADGSDLRLDRLLWVDAGEAVLPSADDRITVDGTAYIVTARDDAIDLDDELDHVRLEAIES